MRGRIILLVVLLLVVVVVVVGALVLSGGGGDTTEGTPTGEADTGGEDAGVADGGVADGGSEATPVPTEGIPLVPVVIALQDLPRGFQLQEAFLSGGSPAVGIAFWPAESVPQNGYDNIDLVRNLWVRSDIPRESPILSTQLVEIPNPSNLGSIGSDAALTIPEGLVAVSLPLDKEGLNSVARAPQPGDSVDIILSFLFVDVDEAFQSRTPNKISVITRSEDGQIIFGGQLEGRPEPSPLSALGVLVSPQEEQRPRLVTQRTIQNARVIYVGYFPADGIILGGRTATPTPFDTPTSEAEGDAQGQQSQDAPPTPEPSPTPYTPTIITLAVTPQQALELVWAIDSQIPTTLALRSAYGGGDGATTAVTMQYLIETYTVPQPALLPFALEPAINSLRQIQLDVFSPISSREIGAAVE